MSYTVDTNIINDWTNSIDLRWTVILRDEHYNSKPWERMEAMLEGIQVCLIYCTDLIHDIESKKDFDQISDEIQFLKDICVIHQKQANS
jgi:hypothetical protein